MGLRLFGSTSGCSCSITVGEPVTVQEPDLSRYSVMKTQRAGACTVAMVRYHNATNYEGTKILVYQGNLPGILDPHFCEHHQSPIARFEPTSRGWDMAVHFAESTHFSA